MYVFILFYLVGFCESQDPESLEKGVASRFKFKIHLFNLGPNKALMNVKILPPVWKIYTILRRVGKKLDGDEKFVLNFDSPIYVAEKGSKDFVDTSGVYVERYNESTAFMDGVVVFHKGLDANTMLEIILEKRTSGKLEMIFSHDICDLCKEISDPQSNYHRYLKYFGIPEECPFEAGEYPIDKLVLETDDYPMTHHTAGKYQATLNLFTLNGQDCKSDRTLICSLKMDLAIELE